MGNTRETSQSSGNQTSTTAPQETEYSKQTTPLDVELRKAQQPQLLEMQSLGSTLINQLLAGKPLPGYLEGLPGGISPEVTSDIVGKSLNDLNVNLAKAGAGTFMESGAAQAIGTRTAADIRNQSEQFNIQNIMQLLNLAVGGQAQVQQPMNTQSSILSQKLAGLTGSTTTGTYSGNQTAKKSYDFFTSPFTLGYMNMVAGNVQKVG